MKWLWIVSGTVLLLLALKDLFRTLFHPGSSGTISDWLSLGLWRAFRRFLPGRLKLAGPIIFLAIIVYWTASVVLGFALIYRPYLPDGFVFMPGIDPQTFDSFASSVNVSIGALITQFVGASSKIGWIQLLSTFEAIFGFAILTASISWILSIYPVLEHRRSLAHEATLLHFGEATGYRPLEKMKEEELQSVLMGLASQLTTHRNELTQFPITYYFSEDERKTALAGVLPYMAELAERFSKRDGGVFIAAVTLGGAVRDYVEVIEVDFLKRRHRSTQEALSALAADHMRKEVHSPHPENASPKAA
jgi:hypothetical protein